MTIADPLTTVKTGQTFAQVLGERWPELKSRTLLITADVSQESEDWLGRLGCRYLVKPFRMGELRAAAASLLTETS